MILKKVKRGEPVSASQWNELIDACNLILGMRAAPPLSLRTLAGGLLLTMPNIARLEYGQATGDIRATDTDGHSVGTGKVTVYTLTQSMTGKWDRTLGNEVLQPVFLSAVPNTYQVNDLSDVLVGQCGGHWMVLASNPCPTAAPSVGS